MSTGIEQPNVGMKHTLISRTAILLKSGMTAYDQVIKHVQVFIPKRATQSLLQWKLYILLLRTVESSYRKSSEGLKLLKIQENLNLPYPGAMM